MSPNDTELEATGLWGQHERAAQRREGNPGALPRRGGKETGLGERARCQQQLVEERALLAPRDLPSGAPRQAPAPCPHPLTAGGCLGPALRLLLSWAELVHFHYEQELLEASSHPMWFHLLVGTEGSCVFTDSRGDPAQSSRGTHLGAQPLSWGSYKWGPRWRCWRPGQPGEGVGPLWPRRVRLCIPPPPPICTGAAQGPRCLCWDLRAPSLPKLQTLGLSLRKNGDADFWHTARGVPLRLF